MKILAFIPARSGSKRIPKKNIKLLKGKSFGKIKKSRELSLNYYL